MKRLVASSNTHDVKERLALDVIKNITNIPTQNVIREIIFSRNNQIDWDEVISIVTDEMPELASTWNRLNAN